MAEACLRTGRPCVSVEDDESDCEIIRNRILAVWKELNKSNKHGAALAIREHLPVAEAAVESVAIGGN